MPLEFVRTEGLDKQFKLSMAYDGTGRRISKTRWVKARGDAGWQRRHVTHYTGIGTEVREIPMNKEMRVVVKSLYGESRKNKLACSYDCAAAYFEPPFRKLRSHPTEVTKISIMQKSNN